MAPFVLFSKNLLTLKIMSALLSRDNVMRQLCVV